MLSLQNLLIVRKTSKSIAIFQHQGLDLQPCVITSQLKGMKTRETGVGIQLLPDEITCLLLKFGK